jgi:hypothetical protein
MPDEGNLKSSVRHDPHGGERHAELDELTDAEAQEVVATPPSIHGPRDLELEYIKQMVAVAKDDIRHVFIYATAALGVAGLFITQIPVSTVLALPWILRVVVVVGLGSLTSASYIFFRYARAMHLNRMRMIRCIPTLHVVRVRELWAGHHSGWQRNKHLFHRAQRLMAFGIVCIGVSLAFLLLGPVMIGTPTP